MIVNKPTLRFRGHRSFFERTERVRADLFSEQLRVIEVVADKIEVNSKRVRPAANFDGPHYHKIK